MKVKKMIGSVTRPAVFIGALATLVTGVTGCVTMEEPLREKRLQEQVKDPRVSIVLLHFKTQQLPPVPKGFKSFSEAMNRVNLRMVFAVANESTGWNFRQLDEFSTVFKTRDASMEPDFFNVETGWVTFIAPPGLSYIAATTYATAYGSNNMGGGQDLAATPFPDRVSVRHSAARPTSGSMIMDFIDMARFAVQVPGPQSLIYAGTIVRSFKCDKGEGSAMTCPYDLTVVDESEIAKTFVNRYLRDVTVTSPMQTQLLTIPQSRTIEIRGGSAGRDQSRQ